MTINILDAVQKKLGYPVLQKISPNTETVTDNSSVNGEHQFSQAAIPAMLTALYKYVQTDAGAETVLRGDYSTDWVNTIFDEKKRAVVATIASYSRQPDAEEKMNDIADEAIRFTKENLPADAGIKDVKTFFSSQRNILLLYLPPALNLGSLLDDDTLDDNIHKMEGPVSSLMQSIGDVFSNPVTKEETKNK